MKCTFLFFEKYPISVLRIFAWKILQTIITQYIIILSFILYKTGKNPKITIQQKKQRKQPEQYA